MSSRPHIKDVRNGRGSAGVADVVNTGQRQRDFDTLAGRLQLEASVTRPRL